MSVLGTFSKGIKEAVSLNFCESGGKYCSKQCQHHPINKGSCYSIRFEHCYPSYGKHLKNKEKMLPLHILREARKEFLKKAEKIRWFRFSVSGSIPPLGSVSNGFKKELKEFVNILKANKVPIHIPVETKSKAVSYTKLLGKSAVVRWSCKKKEQFLSYDEACSYVSGMNIITGKNILKRRLIEAKLVVKEKNLINKCRKSGRTAFVCAAQSVGSKCGKCILCSLPLVDVVYMKH